MAFTSSDLDRIEAAIKTGTLRVQYANGLSVQYQTLDELIRARRMIRAELNADTSSSHTYPRHQQADFSD